MPMDMASIQESQPIGLRSHYLEETSQMGQKSTICVALVIA